MRDSREIMRGMGVAVRSERRAAPAADEPAAPPPLWRQMMADTGMHQAPMVTINVDEGPAYGAAILASVAAGDDFMTALLHFRSLHPGT
jgi:xylulokinase